MREMGLHIPPISKSDCLTFFVYFIFFTAVGITNQRETTVVWDKLTGEPLHNAISNFLILSD